MVFHPFHPHGLFHLGLVPFIVGAFLLPAILYLLTLQRALERCAPESQTLSPGLVWLMFIPVFSLVWHFVIVVNVSRSLRNEFTRRNFPGIEAEPGKGIGLAMCILGACCIIPLLGILCAIAAFICWIIYWVKIHDYSRRLGIPLQPLQAR